MTVGTVIATRFELERVAGQGGMGTVYRARDLLDGSPVALKIVRVADRTDAERFAREAAALAELEHPGVVRYVTSGMTADGRPYLAMQWLEGEDLGRRLESGPLTIAETIELGRRVADALSAAHAAGIVHRDIKPSNLFLEGGRIDAVKIVDFGIARILGLADGVAATRPGTVIGTPGYMAPEQARADRQIDARADVFALGCVLSECLTGTVAFSGEVVFAVLAKILFSAPAKIRALRPEVPAPLEALIARMMDKEPAQRPADGRAVREALTALVDAGRPADGDAAEVPRAITGGAQRLLSIVLAEGVPGFERTATVDDASTASDLTAALAASGGQVQPLANGGLVVVFRGDGAATDLAEQAARCALDLKAVAPRASVAVATGLGDVTGPGLVGDVFDRGARLVAGAAEVRVDDVTEDLIRARFVLGAEGRLLRESPFDDAPHTLLGRPLPCVGRAREVGLLVGIFESCVGEPESRAVVVTGAAGLGKSRLRQEALAALRARWPAVEVWTGRADRAHARSRLVILADALRRVLRLREGDPLVLQRRVLTTQLERHLPAREAQRVAEFIGELVGVPFPDDASVQLRAARSDPRLMGDQMEHSFVRLVGARCALHPVVLVLEDLHWADPATVHFVDTALRVLHAQPFLVVALARPELEAMAPSLWADRRVDRVALAPLGKKAAERLVREVLGDVGDETVARIVQDAEGNPFLLEQLIRAQAEGAGDAPPGSVLAVMQARLDALGEDRQRVLRAGSIFGRTFWRRGVAKLLGDRAPEPELGRWLADLAEHELVTRSRTERFPQQEEWHFRHDLQGEAAYASLPEPDRVLGHRLAAEWLQEVGAKDAVALAGHLEQGGEPARAAGWYAEAAQAALRANDLDGAWALAERAVACGAAGETLGRARALQAEICRWRGDREGGLAAGSVAVELLPPRSDAWYFALADYANALGRAGRLDEVAAFGHELLAAPPSEADAGRVKAAARVAISLLFSGRYALGEALLSSLEALTPPGTEPDPSIAAWVHLVRATRAQFTNDVELLAAEEHACVLAYEALGDLRSAAEETSHEGWALLLLGAYEEAEDILRRAAREGERMGLPTIQCNALHNLGLTVALRGDLEEGLRLERRAADVAGTLEQPRSMAGCRVYEARIQLLRGDADAAITAARAAVELYGPDAPTRASALGVLALALLEHGETREALAAAEEAHRTLERLGTLGEGDTQVRLAYASALAATGEAVKSREVLASARRKLLETASRIGDPALRDSFLRRVPENARVLALVD